MAKFELKGFFEKIEKEKLLDGKNGVLRVQNILFKVPGYTDSFGEKKGEDELFPLTVFGQQIDTFDLVNKAADNPKAKIQFYLNSKQWYKDGDPKDDEHVLYSLYAVLAAVEHVK